MIFIFSLIVHKKSNDVLALCIDSLAESVVQKVGVEVVPPRDEPDADAEEGEAEDEEEGADDDGAGAVAALEAARVHHGHRRCR